MIREQSHQALILFHIHQAIVDHCAENVQKPLCDFRISKVMVVCINTSKSICDFQSYSKIDLSRTDFIISTAYLLRHSIGFISNFSHFPSFLISEFNDSFSRLEGIAFETRVSCKRTKLDSTDSIETLFQSWLSL